MNKYENISSQLVKTFSSLKHKKYRDLEQLFLAEGIKICQELLKSDYECICIIINESIYQNSEIQLLIYSAKRKNIKILLANNKQINAISDTNTPQGVIAICRIPNLKIENTTDILVGLENIQDPGNLGTIVRSAFWFGINNIVISNNSVDIFNPKSVRSTMGNLFHINIIYKEDLIDYFQNTFPEHILFASSLSADKCIQDIIPPQKFALIFGNESNGISKEILNNIQNQYIIKGQGAAESLNLAISAGISFYHFTQNRIKNT